MCHNLVMIWLALPTESALLSMRSIDRTQEPYLGISIRKIVVANLWYHDSWTI